MSNDRTPLEVGLFNVLKDIIDGEWGPYDDAHYWALVDEELPRLGLQREWSDDVAGADWCRYSRWVSETTRQPGPRRIAAGLP